jgi:hypothetical protein
MSAQTYQELMNHYGHTLVIASYAGRNVAIECEECSEVLLDHERGE